jgi:hypothetical protein
MFVNWNGSGGVLNLYANIFLIKLRKSMKNLKTASPRTGNQATTTFGKKQTLFMPTIPI